jgi:hypothetical protein
MAAKLARRSHSAFVQATASRRDADGDVVENG